MRLWLVDDGKSSIPVSLFCSSVIVSFLYRVLSICEQKSTILIHDCYIFCSSVLESILIIVVMNSTDELFDLEINLKKWDLVFMMCWVPNGQFKSLVVLLTFVKRVFEIELLVSLNSKCFQSEQKSKFHFKINFEYGYGNESYEIVWNER
ncbi:unnamed protein product [Lactuca saligna]|uniref:Uncharacterized protein n=1 Tax=Lactuca saligna TaxID=75948 RepID=A0AA35ZWK3_LACSI|nr:unnamed protein product [Lactuca saligna]